jgi:hypothetical protein
VKRVGKWARMAKASSEEVGKYVLYKSSAKSRNKSKK